MKFRALVPLALTLLLAPSCGPCRKGIPTCYKKTCSTGICPTGTYSQPITITETTTQDMVVEVGDPSFAPAADLEEIEEEDELAAQEGFSQEYASQASATKGDLPKAPVRKADKEDLDDEALEVD
ncbi:hypothetical protein H0W26_00745 [Candidatus Dependentiae bacterium]|nr:hypothetical protein [Candidatus Dependentiae bacterium]